MQVTAARGALTVTCAACRERLTLHYEADGDHERYRWQRWVCPLCAGGNDLMLSGHIVQVTILES